MTVHHLNCATMRPLLAPTMIAHVLLVERDEGLMLVDTGFGTGDLADPERLGKPYLRLVRPALDPGETALAQVTALGFSPEDVTDIVVTHLDVDHAGGLADFPDARVHVHQLELEAVKNQPLRHRSRNVPAHWAHGARWVPHAEPDGEWFSFPAVTALGDDVVLVPLPGHTPGQIGVAVREGSGHWLLHAGDAFFDGRQMGSPATCHRGLAGFQLFTARSNKVRRENLERLQELAAAHSDEVTVFCAHDKRQYDALAGGGR
ncbi:MBL fold metallo-hydrolase [Nocardioides bizhenqiangii]|uniref:MBL fold metallo-hydrolase n=1 Tax=Nocardioides bizhenqiangii TaxID=3095076 RepID=A0ABZ0ZQM9_9ACTN|nr:MBL fold metallo-hydrolase [Nocardioides sp. HM61]WQQ26645.1 MBL fold metallo-hydrolase [Nocardioides sp. HM61]